MYNKETYTIQGDTMKNKMHIKSDLCNADLLRELNKSGQLPHTNQKIQQFVLDVYGRKITIQQIAQVLSRYQDRPILADKEVHSMARRFLAACKNDVGLCKRILNDYKGLPYVSP